MAVALRPRLTDDEKQQVLARHGRTCYATGHSISEQEPIHFDHIKAFALGGQSEVNNIAPMCADHNRAKGTLSLFDFRTRLELNRFFNTGDRLTLRHLLEHLQSQNVISRFGSPVATQLSEGSIEIDSQAISRNFATYQCPITGWRYFYATLPVDIIDSDDDQDQLQPRYLIQDKVFELFRHFQTNPVLQPSLGRITENKIKLFDGQHKAAAILWNGRTELECKVYINSDVRLLNQTNISAHDKFSQTRFYTSIMVAKLGAQFGSDFEAYKNIEDNEPKSESGFVNYIRAKDNITVGKSKQNFQNFLYHSVLDPEENRLMSLVASTPRATDLKPLTMNSLTQSLITSFMYREPLSDDLTSNGYQRDNEIYNIIMLMNTLYDEGFRSWKHKAPANEEEQRKLERMVRARFMKAWAAILKDAVMAKLGLIDEDEKIRGFQRELTEQQREDINFLVRRLFGWNMWYSPAGSEIDTVRSDIDAQVRQWVRNHGLTAGYLMGAPE